MVGLKDVHRTRQCSFAMLLISGQYSPKVDQSRPYQMLVTVGMVEHCEGSETVIDWCIVVAKRSQRELWMLVVDV